MGLLNLRQKLRLNRLISEAVDTPALLHDPTWWEETVLAAQGIRELRDVETRLMHSILNFLAGKKTYLVAAATGTLTALHALGKISDGLYQQLLVLLGAGGLAAVRAAIANLGVKL